MNSNRVEIIPSSFENWKICITEKCKIKLTTSFLNERLSAYRTPDTEGSKRFIGLYGIEHFNNVRDWLLKAKDEEKI